MEIRHVAGSGRAWVLVRGHDSSSFNSSLSDNAAARRLHDVRGCDVFYFRLGDHAWVVDDPALVFRIRGLLEPGLELARRQAELGARQAEVGSRQAAAGARMAEAGGRLIGNPAAAATMAAAQAEMTRLAGELQALGRQQTALGLEQDAESRRANAAIDAVMEDLIVEGKAEEV
jgi:bla regulator protein blaR1